MVAESGCGSDQGIVEPWFKGKGHTFFQKDF